MISIHQQPPKKLSSDGADSLTCSIPDPFVNKRIRPITESSTAIRLFPGNHSSFNLYPLNSQ